MAVYSCLHVRVFRSVVVPSSSKVDLFANILPTSLSPAISPYPAISLKLGLGSQRTAALPVQAQHGCAAASSESELLVFYPHKFAQVLTYLRNLPDVRTICRQIVRYGQQLLLAPTSFLTASSRVDGIPNTYVHALLDPGDPSLVYFYAHSDAAHIRGLAIILVAGLSGSPVQTIADMPLAPFTLLITQSFLPARWCSQFMLLLEHMQRKARELIANTVSGDKHVDLAEDVLSIMGLGSLHVRLKDEIDKTRVVHELLGRDDDDGNDLHVDCDDGDGDDVNLHVGREKYEYDENPIDNEDDGLSWRVKKYPPMHTVFYFEADGKDSIASTTPPRWG